MKLNPVKEEKNNSSIVGNYMLLSYNPHNTIQDVSIKKIAILGASDSIMNNGYYNFLKIYEKENSSIFFDRYSIGACTHIVALYNILKHNIADEYNFCIIDYTKLDIDQIFKGYLTIEYAVSIFLGIISLFQGKKCIPIFLFLEFSYQYLKYEKFQKYICDQLNVRYIDAEAHFKNKKILEPNLKFGDPNHYSVHYMKIILDLIKVEIQNENSNINYSYIKNNPINFFIGNKDIQHFIKTNTYRKLNNLICSTVHKVSDESIINFSTNKILCGVAYWSSDYYGMMFIHFKNKVLFKNLKRNYHGFSVDIIGYSLNENIVPSKISFNKKPYNYFEKIPYAFSNTPEQGQMSELCYGEIVDLIFCDKCLHSYGTTWINNNKKFKSYCYLSKSQNYIINEKTNLSQIYAKKAIKSFPLGMDFRSYCINLLRKSNKIDEIIDIAQKGIYLCPQWGQGYVELSKVYDSINNSNKAIKLAIKATEIQPEIPLFWSHLSSIYQKNDITHEAINALEKGLENSPSSRLLYQQLFIIYEKNNNLEKAIELQNKSLIFTPLYLFPFYNRMCSLLLKKKAFSKLKELVEKVHKSLPRWGLGYHYLASVYGAKGENLKAIELEYTGIAKDPLHVPWGRTYLIFLLIKTRQLKDAEKAAQNLISMHPQWCISWRMLSYVYNAKGEIEKALSAAKKAYELDPNGPNIKSNLNNLLKKKVEMYKTTKN